MYRQAYTLFFTFGYRLTRRLISTDGDEGDLSRRGFDALFIQERKVDFLNNIENCMGCSISLRNLASRVLESRRRSTSRFLFRTPI
jgi:hypothetical protein